MEIKNKDLIYANLISKIAMLKTGFNRSDRLKEHIRMLDWVISPYRNTRTILDIIYDKNYQLSPDDYFKTPRPKQDS